MLNHYTIPISSKVAKKLLTISCGNDSLQMGYAKTICIYKDGVWIRADLGIRNISGKYELYSCNADIEHWNKYFSEKYPKIFIILTPIIANHLAQLSKQIF